MLTRVITRCVYDWDDALGRYITIAENTRWRFTPVASCKGATAEQNDLEASQAGFYKTLQGAYQQQFANQNAIFSAVRAVYDPIFNAGPNQYGFSAPEDQALRSKATQDTTANYKQAEQATSERLAAAGGGNSLLPSGVAAGVDANLKAVAAGQTSAQNLGITQAGYEQGRQNFLNASGVLMDVAKVYNPLGFAGAATGAGNSAFNMASEIQKANAAASPWGTVGGLVGGALGSFAGPIGASIGSKIGGMLGNAGGGNSNVNYDTISFGGLGPTGPDGV